MMTTGDGGGNALLGQRVPTGEPLRNLTGVLGFTVRYPPTLSSVPLLPSRFVHSICVTKGTT